MIEYWTAQSRPSSTNGRARIALPALEPQQVIVVANRQPFSHDYGPDGSIVVKHAHSGVVHAVEPLIAARSGVWVAQGTGAADEQSSIAGGWRFRSGNAYRCGGCG